MTVLYDAQGSRCWVTITDDGTARYLYLDGCEEGAMALASDAPVFHYLWFHRLSVFAGDLRRALVLGAGAFTAAKAFAQDHPSAEVDAVDIESELGPLGRRFFRLDEPAFVRVRFHAADASEFLTAYASAYDFIFDDLFDGFHHVPASGRGGEHAGRVAAALKPGGACVKNLIWDRRSADCRAACAETAAAWRERFPGCLLLALGDPAGGHNLLLVGRKDGALPDWLSARERLAGAGVPAEVLDLCHPLAEPPTP